MRWLPRVLSLLLLAWVLVLLLAPPASRNFQTSDETRRVGCASVVEAGWPWKGDPERAQDEVGGPLTDSYGGGLVPSAETQQYIADRCQDLRTGRTALAGLLAVPIVLLGLSRPGRRGSPPLS